MLFLRFMAVLSNTHLPTMNGDEKVTLRPARPAELPVALAMILGSPRRLAPAGQVAEFINAAIARKMDINAIWVAEKARHVVWAVLPVVNPGRTALLLTSSDIDADSTPAASALVGEICGNLARQGLHLTQVLLESQHAHTRQFFAAMKFREIADLIYLQGPVPRNMQPAVPPQHMHWVEYSPQTHGVFAEAIVQSYQDSLDCPALSGMREIDDVIAGHRATGDFSPSDWQVLLEGERPLGIVLLSRIVQTDAMELVYLGLAAKARGRGLGSLLMRHALYLTLQGQRRRISLAVDSKNTPAIKLYYRFGMQQVATRTAMIRDLRVS
jgi:mycothiol synthase